VQGVVFVPELDLERLVGEALEDLRVEPGRRGPRGAAICRTVGASSSACGCPTSNATPPISMPTPSTAPAIDQSEAPVSRSRVDTYPAIAMIAAATSSATTEAAVWLTSSRIRENTNNTNPITARAVTGIRIGSRSRSRGAPLTGAPR